MQGKLLIIWKLKVWQCTPSKFLNMSSVFVTGGGGYLGEKLCRYLLQNGYSSVTAFDVYYSDDENDVDGLIKIKV